MQSYTVSIAGLSAKTKLSETAIRDKIMQRLTEAEGIRRPFGKSRNRNRDNDNGMTQDELYEV